jgi:protein gp37
MSEISGIPWCDSAADPTAGCDGCELHNAIRNSCYAVPQHSRHAGRHGYGKTFDEVTLLPGRMTKAARWSDLSGKARPDKPWLDGQPRLIFVSNLTDALSKVVPFEYLKAEIIDNVTSDRGRRHQWLWLTKRPQRMARFSAWLARQGATWPTNLWAGTSITDRKTLTRVEPLLRVGNEETHNFLSVEPQIELIDLAKWLPRIGWVIQCGEAGKDARPFDLDWARFMLVQCREFEVPYFLTQLGTVVLDGGEPVEFQHRRAGDWNEWPAELRVREFPVFESLVGANA